MTESERAAAELVSYLRTSLGTTPPIVLNNIDDGDVIVHVDDAPSFMIHVEYL